ncbi:MAG: hypothetical protein ACLR6J_10100 [Parabacteroides merdae]
MDAEPPAKHASIGQTKKIALSVADKIEFVEIGSIIRCESESNYTTFYLKSGEKLIVSKVDSRSSTNYWPLTISFASTNHI